MAYKVVVGASAGLYWVFKRETYPHEHVIPQLLPESCHSTKEPRTWAMLEPRQKKDGTDSGVIHKVQSHASEVPKLQRVVVETTLRNLDEDSACEGDLTIDTALTSISPPHAHEFPVVEVDPERLSQLLNALQVTEGQCQGEHSTELDWLNLAFSNRQENEWPYDIPSFEDWRAGIIHESLVIEEDAVGAAEAGVLPQPTEQTTSPSEVESEREEINLDTAFKMRATDLEDDDELIDMPVDVSIIIADSAAFHSLIVKLERARKAIFVGARGQISQQEPRLQRYILGDVIAQAGVEFANLPKERWNAEGWAYATGVVKYSQLHVAHEYRSVKGYFQRPRLEESERSCDWSWESKFEEFQRLPYPRVYSTDHHPSQPKDENVLITTSCHHENYLGYPIDDKTSTSPEVSLWVTHLARRRKAMFDPLTRKGVIVSQATKTVDSYQYTGPPEILEMYQGTQLENAIVGHVNRVYTPSGSWQYWEYQDEAVPMLPSDVTWFANAEHGFEGMQPPYFMCPHECRDIVVNGDCGIHGPPRRLFPFGEKAKPHFCGSPLRYELLNSQSSLDAKTEAKPFETHLLSIAEEVDDMDDAEPELAVTHLPSMAEKIYSGPAAPVEYDLVHLLAISEGASSVEQLEKSGPCGILDGLSEEAIDLENDEFYGASVEDSGTASTTIEAELIGTPPTHWQSAATGSTNDILSCVMSRPEKSLRTVPRSLDDVDFGEDEDYTSSWTKTIRKSENPRAAHLARFSEDSVNQQPECPENPMAKCLAKWSDEMDVQDHDFEGDLGYFETDMVVFRGTPENEMEEHGGESVSEVGDPTVDEVSAPHPASNGFDSLISSPTGTTTRSELALDDAANEAVGDVSDLATVAHTQSEVGSGSSTPDHPASSSGHTFSSPSGDESSNTTPDHRLDIQLEITALEERLSELYAKKYASEYTSLDQFQEENVVEERIPLFPIVGHETPPAAKVVTGILAQAGKHPELDEYFFALTAAMVSKDLRIKPAEELELDPALIDANDFEGYGESPVPDGFRLLHPAMLFDAEAARLAEAAEAVRVAEALKAANVLMDAEMEDATLAEELQDLEDNAAINGTHIFLERGNADVALQTDADVTWPILMEAPVAEGEPVDVITEQTPIVPATEAFAEPFPTRAYVHYSDILELQSAPAFNEHLYGTIDLGIAKKVEKLARKLKIWGNVRSGKLGLGA